MTLTMMYIFLTTTVLTTINSQQYIQKNQLFQNARRNACPWCHLGVRDHSPLVRTHQREKKFLPVFTVVQFSNQACTATSGENGTCVAGPECVASGGLPRGPCANTFGVCCVFSSTCGQSTNRNCTYFVNNGYPNTVDKSGTCQLTIHKAHPDVCQFRLDFEEFSIMGPEQVNHLCSNDQFVISGSNNVNPICGQNNGNHMYIDAGSDPSSPVSITVVTNNEPFPRKWKIRVCQIPCSSNYRADEGCLQYYTGISGQIKSFNYDPSSGLHLSNQDYGICIRTERTFCSIEYKTCSDIGNNRSHSFTLTGNTLGQNDVAGSVSMGCQADWLVVPCVVNSNTAPGDSGICVDRVCGGTLNTDSSTVSSPVTSSVRPFRLFFHTDNVEAPNDMGNKGFCIEYTQQPCTST